MLVDAPTYIVSFSEFIGMAVERVLIGYAAPSNTYYLHDMIGSLLRIYNMQSRTLWKFHRARDVYLFFGGGGVLRLIDSDP